jgi:hypothetical protein
MPIELNLQNFLVLQGVLLVVGLLYLARRPNRTGGLRLSFKGRGGPEKGSVVEFKGNLRSRELQVFFNYNGHTFEAYEVLGLPAGASMKMVQQNFNQQKILADSESRPFLEAAYNALNSSLKSAKN